MLALSMDEFLSFKGLSAARRALKKAYLAE